jgi:hypothetical protein
VEAKVEEESFQDEMSNKGQNVALAVGLKSSKMLPFHHTALIKRTCASVKRIESISADRHAGVL